MSNFQKEKKGRKESRRKAKNETNSLTKNFSFGIYFYLIDFDYLDLQISVKFSVSNPIDKGSLSEIHFNLIETK